LQGDCNSLGEIKCFQKHKLIIGILTTLSSRQDEIIKTLSDEIGEIDYISPLMDFNYTDYYDSEMGDNIRRVFVSFKNLVDPSKLADIKIHTNYLEKLYSVRVKSDEKHDGEEHRRVNFDPGLLCSSRLILATTKDNVHRVPVRDGIYEEVTLIFRGGRFEALPWTYADYRTEEYEKVFMKIREIYKSGLKAIH